MILKYEAIKNYNRERKKKEKQHAKVSVLILDKKYYVGKVPEMLVRETKINTLMNPQTRPITL